MTDPSGVNAGNGPPRSVMLTIGELAARDGVTAPAVSRRVKQFREKGLLVETDALNRVTAVNSVQYDELRGKFADPSKAQAPKAPVDTLVSESYDEALRQRTWTEAERSRLKLAVEKGELLPVDKIADALAIAGGRIVQAIDRVMSSADDLAAAVAKDGTSGVRAELKKLVHRLKTEVADALASIAAETPETEPDE